MLRRSAFFLSLIGCLVACSSSSEPAVEDSAEGALSLVGEEVLGDFYCKLTIQDERAECLGGDGRCGKDKPWDFRVMNEVHYGAKQTVALVAVDWERGTPARSVRQPEPGQLSLYVDFEYGTVPEYEVTLKQKSGSAWDLAMVGRKNGRRYGDRMGTCEFVPANRVTPRRSKYTGEGCPDNCQPTYNCSSAPGIEAATKVANGNPCIKLRGGLDGYANGECEPCTR